MPILVGSFQILSNLVKSGQRQSCGVSYHYIPPCWMFVPAKYILPVDPDDPWSPGVTSLRPHVASGPSPHPGDVGFIHGTFLLVWLPFLAFSH